MFVFFALLAANTLFRFDVRSRPLYVLQDLIDTIMTSWLGDNITAMVLMILAVGVPLLTMRKSYEPSAQLTLNSTKSALKGKVYKPTQSELLAAGKPMFGKRG